MKITITFLLLLIFTSIYAQTDDYKKLVDSAKALFRYDKELNQAQLDSFDYNKVVSLWEEVVRLNPNNAEAWYFLGYAYGRSNSRDGRGMIHMNLQILLKTSAAFEKVIELSPHYNGEIIVQDPYSKLTAEWGTMAMKYIYQNKPDSALWAFGEGKKRGGFSDVILAMNRLALDQCSKNAILVCSGDNFTVPLWYLHYVEGHRTDVAIVDINMLNTIWYPRFLAENKTVHFDMPLAEMDTIEYIHWTAKKITIKGFKWLVKPSYYDAYLLRGDRVFLSLLKQNKFQRDLFFTVNFPKESRLSLDAWISSYVYADKLTVKGEETFAYEKYKATIKRVLMLAPQLSLNRRDEMRIFDYYRLSLMSEVLQLAGADKMAEAKELIHILDQYCNEEKLPYHSEEFKKYADKIRRNVVK